MVTVTPRPTKYSNHYAVPAADLGEGDYIFSRLVTEATEWDGDRTAIEFRLADGSLIVAAPEDVFPAQFPAREDPVDFSEYPEWNGQNFIPKGVKLNKRLRPTPQQLASHRRYRVANRKRLHQVHQNDCS